MALEQEERETYTLAIIVIALIIVAAIVILIAVWGPGSDSGSHSSGCGSEPGDHRSFDDDRFRDYDEVGLTPICKNDQTTTGGSWFNPGNMSSSFSNSD